MVGPPISPISLASPRPRYFPNDADLLRLIDTKFDPASFGFTMRIKRCQARALRKALFGSKGLLVGPDQSGGVMEFDLPNGWRLRLTYYVAGEFDEKLGRFRAGEVDAKFIPPRRRLDHLTQGGQRSSPEEARL